jgi:hypothetical protein
MELRNITVMIRRSNQLFNHHYNALFLTSIQPTRGCPAEACNRCLKRTKISSLPNTIEKNDKIKEHKILQLNIDKTRKVLKWKPVLNLEETIRETVFWYKSVVYEKKDAVKITSEQISSFFNKI